MNYLSFLMLQELSVYVDVSYIVVSAEFLTLVIIFYMSNLPCFAFKQKINATQKGFFII